MNATQVPYLVEGILILASMISGILLGRAGKPYGKVKLVIHLFLSLWFTVGVAYILYGQFTVNGTKVTWIPDAIMGLMVLTQLVTGIQMMVSRTSGTALPRIHFISTVLMLLTDLCAFVVAGYLS